MHQTWNQHIIKKENKTVVLETIINHTPISRAAIAQQTGLNKSTVSSLVQELLGEKIIEESGPGESSGGRRPVMLLFNQTAGFSIAIDLRVHDILGVLTDLEGNIVHEQRVPIETTNFNQVMKRLMEVIDTLIKAAPASPYGIVGIGIGVPGVISNEGEILLAPNMGWKRIDLKAYMEQHYHLPVVIENEANAGAYGEKVFGFEEAVDHMVYASIGAGIGVGLILDNKLYKGMQGFSGELGHMTIEKDGIPCSCGNKGCWERYASEQALIEQAYEAKLIDQNTNDPLHVLIDLANSGDETAIDLFNTIGTCIGIGLTNCINIFNPRMIVIGNQMAKAEKWIRPAMEHMIEEHAIGFHQEQLNVQFSSLHTYSTVYGMSAFTMEQFLQERPLLE